VALHPHLFSPFTFLPSTIYATGERRLFLGGQYFYLAGQNAGPTRTFEARDTALVPPIVGLTFYFLVAKNCLTLFLILFIPRFSTPIPAWHLFRFEHANFRLFFSSPPPFFLLRGCSLWANLCGIFFFFPNFPRAFFHRGASVFVLRSVLGTNCRFNPLPVFFFPCPFFARDSSPFFLLLYQERPPNTSPPVAEEGPESLAADLLLSCGGLLFFPCAAQVLLFSLLLPLPFCFILPTD